MNRFAVMMSCVFVLGAAPAMAAASGDAIILSPEKVTFTDAPQFGPGAQVAVLAGDPAKAGPYVVRLKLPAGSAVGAHTHSDAENVTIISGGLALGLGETPDKAKAQELGPGAFFLMPAQTPHYAWTTAETVVQIHGMGPSETKMLEASGSSEPHEHH